MGLEVIWLTRHQELGGSQCVMLCGTHPDMLSGEQAELFPVDTLVSMLSELSRLRVS